MVAVQDMLRQVSDRIETSSSARAIFGEPVTQGGKTVIPVARLKYTYGAGGGSGEAPDMRMPAAERVSGLAAVASGSGGGGGAMVSVVPVGYIEITPESTRFVSVEENQKMVRMAFWGGIIAWFLLMRQVGKVAKRRR